MGVTYILVFDLWAMCHSKVCFINLDSLSPFLTEEIFSQQKGIIKSGFLHATLVVTKSPYLAVTVCFHINYVGGVWGLESGCYWLLHSKHLKG